MDFDLSDTIAALASASGPARRHIIRVSGDVRTPLTQVFQSPTDWQSARVAHRYLGCIALNDFSSPIRVALHYWPTGRSYTGEPMAELHVPGSPPISEAILARIYNTGVRPARAGEFTLRSFLAGRVDLVQAEAVLGVIDADQQQELEEALNQLAGGVSGQLHTLRGRLLETLSDLEAGLDFVDEDIEFISREEICRRLSDNLDELQAIEDHASGRMLNTGRVRVVLAGLPNAGKSTLFNRLTESTAAIVSSIEGTTRDYLHRDIDCRGVEITLVDTAGTEADPTGISALAQAQREQQVGGGDLVLWCTAADLAPRHAPANEAGRAIACQHCLAFVEVVTKSDVAARPTTGTLHVSAETGAGIDELQSAIAEQLSNAETQGRSLIGTTASRCADSLRTAIAALKQAIDAAEHGAGDELLAVELHAALHSLGQIVGEVYTDDILDRIFSKFCIGK